MRRLSLLAGSRLYAARYLLLVCVVVLTIPSRHPVSDGGLYGYLLTYSYSYTYSEDSMSW